MIYEVFNIYDLIRRLKNNKGPFVLKCYMPWCGHCQRIEPLYKELSEKYDNIIFMEVNMENGKDIGDYYGITGYPTFLIFKTPDSAPIKVVGADMSRLETTLKAL